MEHPRLPGGITYGYDKVHKLDDRGEPIRGLRKINEEQAAIIRRIFDEFLIGKSPRAIAADLNAEGIPSPRGGTWMASTISGNPARQNGILCNDLYNGQIVYNRQSFVKDPDTGKRKSRSNPFEDWTIEEIEELRIMKDEARALDTEKQELAKELKILEKDNVVPFTPLLSSRFRKEMKDLIEALKSDDNTRLEAIGVLRSLITVIILTPGEKRGEMHITIKGNLAALINFSEGNTEALERTAVMVVRLVFEPNF